MRLTWLHRVGLVILGAAALGGAVALSIMDVGAAGVAGVIGLIFPGFLVVTFAIVGVFPNVHLKEGNIDWPKIEEPKPVMPADDLRPQVGQLRTELERVGKRLDDYILANGPVPDDDFTDEQRLPAFRRAYEELEAEMYQRMKTGEDHDDGLSTEDLRKVKEEAYDALAKEERRQWAQFEFGMKATQPGSIYDD